ncbi:SulP family inorganic anion transporter [Brevibacillus ruminantium]|uniref:SulP family inorganic anion transporter n=1 Tax=Brevibacillus ruminantium TaxID=2950604 RepID=A0ABY4WL29_9BACL|nr:SulP family inorganic anion transporter [Brevibacillus ruminantium]USG66767.1 SulP family inorganic anion transporter [Brevibacillus ruminantium]
MARILLDRFSGYSARHFQKDLTAGVIVGVIAIPLGMAFSIASGVKPEYGIYTTIIAGILLAFFGGSRYQISGPTGAFIPILFGIVMTYGYQNLLIAGFLAGVMLFIMGILRLGSLITFIPRPVTVGFTSGIAVVIFTGQIANFLGLSGIQRHEDFLSNGKEILLHLSTVNLYSVTVALVSLVSILLMPRLSSKLPGALVGLVLSSLLAAVLFPEKTATIGSTFGEISNSLPSLSLPALNWETISHMLAPAFVIAMLGGIESLLSAVVADGMTGTKHNSNRELIGQGLTNMVVPLFGGIPATGAIARTATNIRNGAASPLSSLIHALVVLLVLVLFAPYASAIPLASMAPILMVVAWNMSERHVFVHILKSRTSDSLVMIITFLLTIFVNLMVAVEVGLLLAAILFIKRMSDVHAVTKVLPDFSDKHQKVRQHVVTEWRDCPQISLFTVEGPLFFGAAQLFEKTIMSTVQKKPRVLILRMAKVPYLDITGEYYLRSISHQLRNHGGLLLISGLQDQPKRVLKKTGLDQIIGEAQLYVRTGDAISAAISLLDVDKCRGCKHFAFHECKMLSALPEKEVAHSN